MTAVGISRAVEKFVSKACERQTDGTLQHVEDHTGQYKQVRTLSYSYLYAAVLAVFLANFVTCA